MKKQLIGKRGEDIALAYLLKKGLVLRERNWRCNHLELDLVMESDMFLHIVEVRSRSEPYLVSPIDSVIKKKQTMIVKGAMAYIKRKNIKKEISFDIVTVTYYKDHSYDIKYYERAFYPIYYK